MRSSVMYGFDPHDDSDYLNIHDNKVYDNGDHGIIASKRCSSVSIKNNEVYDGGNAGIFLHRSSNNGVVSGTSSTTIGRRFLKRIHVLYCSRSNKK